MYSKLNTRLGCSFISFFYLILSMPLFAGEVFESFPDKIDPEAIYLIYSHGRILEGNSTRPEHPRWGVYGFPEIREALVDGTNWVLLGEHRKKDTDVHFYSDQLVTWVKTLIGVGVKPNHITLIGFSKGGIITSLAANKLKELDINTVLLASCWGRSDRLPEFFLENSLLSIYESSDSAGSCAYLVKEANRQPDTKFKELKINTGKEHGAFFQPREQWISPVKDWIESQIK